MINRWMLFILLSIVSFSWNYAQGVLSVDVGVGPTYGFGKFADKDVQEDASGFSSIGGITNLYIGVKPTKYIGFCFYGGLSMHLLDVGSLKDHLNTQYGTNLSVDKKHHRYGFATGGITFGGQVKNFYFLEGRITAGYLWTEIPSLRFSENDVVYFEKYRTPGSGWAVNAAFSFRYAVYGPLYIRTTLDFLYSQPAFENAIIEYRANNQPETRFHSFTQPIAAFGLTAGIGVSF